MCMSVLCQFIMSMRLRAFVASEDFCSCHSVQIILRSPQNPASKLKSHHHMTQIIPIYICFSLILLFLLPQSSRVKAQIVKIENMLSFDPSLISFNSYLNFHLILNHSIFANIGIFYFQRVIQTIGLYSPLSILHLIRNGSSSKT